MEARVIDWDGNEIPPGLKSLPPGRYVVEPIDDCTALTPEEDEGLREALADLEAGHKIPMDEVMRSVMGDRTAE